VSGDFEQRVDYEQVAPTYDERFAYYAGARKGVGAALIDLVREVQATRVLDVGCGTGHWLRVLRPLGCTLYGLDLSPGMLSRARAADLGNLVRGSADALPFPRAVFDLVFCVSALHHFADAAHFIREGRSLLRPGGALAVVGMNPHAGGDRWYLYDYFPGTQEMDLRRYPSAGTIANWMFSADFGSVRWQVVERFQDVRTGRAILDEAMLQKNATSQLALLTEKEYSAGLARIRTAIAQAEAACKEIVFSVDISLHMVVGLVAQG
jgi:ubiquinone/menaquinone biosynthesis C-methylase UbiE